jgi:hypothetical protein
MPSQQAASAVYHVQGGQVEQPQAPPAPVVAPPAVVPAPLPCIGCNPIPLPIGAGYSPDWLDGILAREADYSACGPDPCADGIPVPVWAGPAANNLGIGFTYGPNPYLTIPDHRHLAIGVPVPGPVVAPPVHDKGAGSGYAGGAGY